MKIIFAILFGLIACTLAVHVCFPEEFTTDEVIYRPQQQDVFGARRFFSVAAQKERIDFDVIIEHQKPLKEKVSFLFDFPKGKWFEIHYINNTASCNVYNNLTGKLTPRCLSKNAQHRGTVLVGGVLVADNFIEKVDIHGDKVRADILIDANINVPIRAIFRDVRGITREEYWNFKESVHHDAFVIPNVCQSAQEISDSKDIQNKYQQFQMSYKASIN